MSERTDELLAELTLEEKCGLTAGAGMWWTSSIERLDIAAVGLTDGPNGARGPVLAGEGTLTSACVPCGMALGATWDPDLVAEVGRLVGEESLAKGCRVLLAPTVNLVRSPIAGRNFECMSEDPFLAGIVASGFIRGAQSAGVACTVKHFVGNEAEFERGTTDSVIDERTLRELYLRPFELAVTRGDVLGMMTGYNRLNGTWCAEHPLLRDVVRGEWGFEGFVVSDWGAVGSTRGSVDAGLDLEMPGPGRYYGEHLREALQRGDISEADVDVPVRRLLEVLDRIGALGEQPAAPQAIHRPEDRALARRASSASMVLLSNDGVLPVDPGGLRSIAVIGPNVEAPTVTGGGASNFKPHRRPNVLRALQERFPDVSATFEPGAARPGAAPIMPMDLTVEVRRMADGGVVTELMYPDTQVLFPSGPPGIDGGTFHVRAEGTFHLDRPGTYTFTSVQISPSIVYVDESVVVDGVRTPPQPGRFPWAPQPLTAEVELDAGEHMLVVETSGGPDHVMAGFTIGCRMAVHEDALERAVAAAADAEVVLLVVGTDATWETEAVDRRHMDLPGRQDELIEAVCNANPNTIVVLNCGAPVTMQWADRPAAVIQGWFGGQEFDHALLDVLTGADEPGGRLPTTFPLRLEHNPSFGTFPGENGVLRYGEGIFIGYRWYDSRHLPVAFPFGHGLSYTSFGLGEPTLVEGDQLDLTVTVPVTNTGDRRGSEVVQCYVAPPPTRRPRPAKELRAFAKVTLEPGEAADVELRLDRRSFARWDPALPDHDAVHAKLDAMGGGYATRPSGPATGRWVVDAGTYEVCIGRSVDDIAYRMPFVVDHAEE